MAIKETGPAEGWLEIDRWSGGVGWIAYPDETMQRASHLLAVDGDVWVVDPVDIPDLDDLVAEFGTLRGVVLLLDRHKRDATAVANRHDVPVYLPDGMEGSAGAVNAPVERFLDGLPDTGYTTIEVVNNRFWQEFALYDGESGTLVIPEAVGTTPYFELRERNLGVHPVLRLWPPRKSLHGLRPERILVGHGEGVFEDAAPALRTALAVARRSAPKLYARAAWRLLTS
ncbi:hypothetical protein BRC81_03925 [Halobacteriales archaeon QS_1_68_20]|nr:MAG: hypothetical protein BRC81_03925 [Halobacteriales archaeon QS_1_68_20]